MEADVCTPPLASPFPTSPRNSIEKKFILTFESLPVLWDKSNPNYTNKYRRNEALKKLHLILRSKQSNATVFDVKKKINSLRTNYRRDLRKIVSSRRAGEVYVPRSWTFKYLRFLDRNDDYLEMSQHQDCFGDEIDTRKNMIVESPTDLRPKESLSPELEMPDPIALPIKHCDIEDSGHQMYTENFAFQSISSVNANATAVYWAEKLARLSNTQRIYAEKAINEVLFEAELGNLNKNSVRINDIY